MLSTTAFAGSLIYTGVDVGYATKGSSDNSTYGFHVGTNLIPLLGLEVGYRDFGSFGGTDYSSYYAAIMPRLSLGSFQVYLKGGVNMYDMSPSIGKSNDGTDLLYGAGANYFASDMISIGASYTKFGFEGDDVDTFALVVTLHLL